MNSPLLRLPGAVSGDDAAASVPAHFGEPLREQRAYERGDAVVDLSHLAVITVSGADRLTWIDSMTSQRVRDLAPGSAAETLLLSPQGRIEIEMQVVDDGETLWVLTAPESAEALESFLIRMRFALRVEVRQRDDVAVLGAVVGGTAEAALRALPSAHAVWVDPWREVQPGGFQYASDRVHPAADATALRVIVPSDACDAIVDQIRAGSLRAAGLLAVRAVEVATWRPTADDLDERALPHEFDWLRSAVHLSKGCYRGQETVAKVHNLGHPPRRLVFLHLDGSAGELPADGALVTVAGHPDQPVGRVTRAATHHELGPIALALVKRSTPADAVLEVAGSDHVIPANQELIVPPDAGRTREVPRLKRI